MNLGRRLYELQELDLHIEKTSETLSRVEHQLNHNEALEKAKSDLEAIQKDQAALQQKQRDAEHAVDDIQAKLKPIQQKLFALGPTYEIYRDGSLAAIVKKELFTFFRCSFEIDVDGPDDLTADGSFTDHGR